MKYFTFHEMERSEKAVELGIDNSIPEDFKGNVRVLVERVLDPLRQAWGRPIHVNSGYRCPAVNKAVGGSRTSHHLRGMAADITTFNVVDNRRLFQLILDLHLPFTQLIDERNFSWVHVSLDPDDIRHEIKKL